MFLIILTLLSALSISITAAYFSIIGLGNVFAATFIPVVIMASTIEFGKIVGTSWLYQTWDITSKKFKSILMLMIFGAMVITSIGVFGFLSKGHLDVQAPIDQKQLELVVKNEELDNVKERIAFIDEEIKNYRMELDALQKQIDSFPEQYASKKITAYKEQLPRRKEINEAMAKLRSDKTKEMTIINEISGNRAKVKSDIIVVEGDIGPIKYVAAMLGIPDAEAVRLLIVLLIIIFDPFAIVLFIAANMSIARYMNKKQAGLADFVDHVKQKQQKPTIRRTSPITTSLADEDDVMSDTDDFIQHIEQVVNDDIQSLNDQVQETIHEPLQEQIQEIPLDNESIDHTNEVDRYINALTNTNTKGDIDKNLF